MVSAKAVSKTTDVEIVQATGLSGTAIVKFVDKNTVEENLYYLNFDRVSVSDDFNNDRVGSQWEWVRENPEHLLCLPIGWLTITTEKGDISERSNDAKNILLQSANNDWTIDTKIIASRMPSQPKMPVSLHGKTTPISLSLCSGSDQDYTSDRTATGHT